MAENDLRLDRNELPYAPPEGVRATAGGAIEDVRRYPSWDALELRTAIAEQYCVEPDWVVAASGSISVIQQAMLAAGPGEVIFSWPSFDAFPPLAAALRMRANFATLEADGSCDLEDMRTRINANTRLIIVCTPNTPTGGAVRRRDLQEFVAAVPPEVIVLVDGAYAEFVSDIDAVIGPDLVHGHPNVIITRTFSKAYALAGLRVGYGIAQPALAQAVARTGVPYALTNPAEAAALEALGRSDHMRRNVVRVNSERSRMAAGLAGLGVEVVTGHGNFVWLPLPERAELVAAALARAGIMVKPYPQLGIRISVGTAEGTDRLLSSWPGLATSLIQAPPAMANLSQL
ncbi:histidinol-phosphate transaminase [Pseudonocardia eucalypti]|uniref:Histidinol-phosphate transaminase n=1 Tax=Pseudonocardia eucalypti TaxID=648755 RepID=A0ABP9QCH9_9PSEU|nr:histidinol-phosphate aminotransferase [Pseudonocardia eucalypti]